jgi:hypothetical protein
MGKSKPARPKKAHAAGKAGGSGGVSTTVLAAAAVAAAAGAATLLLSLGGGPAGGTNGPNGPSVTVRAIENGAAIGAGEPADPRPQLFDHNLTASDFVGEDERYAVFTAATGRRVEYALPRPLQLTPPPSPSLLRSRLLWSLGLLFLLLWLLPPSAGHDSHSPLLAVAGATRSSLKAWRLCSCRASLASTSSGPAMTSATSLRCPTSSIPCQRSPSSLR